MTINGKFGFRTSAVFDPLLSLFVKYDFYMDGEKISINTFMSNISQPYNLLNVKVTVLVTKNNSILYSREFPDFLEYSVAHPSRKSILESSNLYPPVDADIASVVYRNALPLINVFIEPSSIGGFDVYGIISPNQAGYQTRIRYEPLFTRCYFPDLSFKNHDPLIEIGGLTYLPYLLNGFGRIDYNLFGQATSISSSVGTTLLNGRQFYVGNGLFIYHQHCRNHGETLDKYMSAALHKYPVTQITPPLETEPHDHPYEERTMLIPVDFGIESPVNYGDGGSDGDYIVSIKDIKNGDVYYAKNYSTLQDNKRIYTTNVYKNSGIFSSYFDNNPRSFGSKTLFETGFFHTRSSFFCFDENIFTSEIQYNPETKKMVVKLQKNVPESIAGINNTTTIFDVIMSNKTFQEKICEVNFFLEFISALLETYPNNNYGWWGVFTPNKRNCLFYGMPCHSSETMASWAYCGSIFDVSVMN